MKLFFIILLFSSVTIFGSFTFNYQNKMNFPDLTGQISYAQLSSQEQNNLSDLLSSRNIRDAVDSELLQSYQGALREYKRGLQLVGASQREEKRLILEPYYRRIIEELSELERQSPELFSNFTEDPSFQLSRTAEEPDGLPGFCANYPQTRPEQIQDYFSGAQDRSVFTGCLSGQSFNVGLESVVTSLSQIEDRRFREQEKVAKENLMTFIAKDIYKNRANYEGFFPNLPNRKGSEELNTCLEEKASTFPEFTQSVKDHREVESSTPNPEAGRSLQNNFMTFHASQALLATAHLEKLERARSNLRAFRNQTGQGGLRKCARNGGGTGGLSCSELRTRRSAQALVLTNAVSELEVQVESMMEESPLLFEFENQPTRSTLDFVNIKITGSQFLSDIKESIPGFSDLAEKTSQALEDRLDNSSALASLSASSNDQLKAFLEASKSSDSLKLKAQAAVAAHLNSIDEGLINICENEGEYLHYYPEMFPEVLNHSIKDLTNQSVASEEVINTQAGLCSMYRRSPPGSEGSGFQYWLGLGAVGVGSIMSFTGVGTLAGAGLIVVGGGAMAEDAFSRAQEARVRSSNALALSRTSWGSVREALESHESSLDARNGAYFETAMVVPDALGFGLASRAILRLPNGALRLSRAPAGAVESTARALDEPVENIARDLAGADAEGRRLEEIARAIPAQGERAIPNASQVRNILDSSVDSLDNPTNANLLFDTASNFRTEMEEFGLGLVADIRGVSPAQLQDGTAYSVLKRDSRESFIEGVREKIGRKGYETIGQMGDMVRGRFNLESRLEVENVVETMVRRARAMGLEVDEVVSPRGRMTTLDVNGNSVEGFAYDRYHVVLKDPETGMLHEWQIGTRKVTEIYESQNPGIPVTNPELAGWMGSRGINRDIHDINYDVFNEIIAKSNNPRIDPAIRAEMAEIVEDYGLVGINNRVSGLVADAGANGDNMLETTEKLGAIHTELGAALNGIVEEKGVDFITRFFHVLDAE